MWLGGQFEQAAAFSGWVYFKSWFKSASTFTAVSWRFRFDYFSWMLPQATDNSVMSHVWPTGC